MPPCPRRCCSSYFPSLLNCSVLICHLLFFAHRQYLLLEVNRKATTDTAEPPHPTPHLPCPYGLALLFWIHRAKPTPHHPFPTTPAWWENPSIVSRDHSSYML